MSKDKKTGGKPTDDKSAKDTHYATLRRAHRDSKRERGEIPTPPPQKRRRGAEDWKPPALAPEQVYLYGLHTVRAALDNKERRNVKLSVTQNALARLEIAADALGIPVEIVAPHDIDKVLGPDAIHQGVMLETRPLPVRRLEALKDSPLLLVLDQVTDPHNVGAIMRSAVAFNAGAVITTQRHSPTESGVLAKSASARWNSSPISRSRTSPTLLENSTSSASSRSASIRRDRRHSRAHSRVTRWRSCWVPKARGYARRRAKLSARLPG